MSYARWVQRLRWPIVALWLLAALFSVKFLPSLSQVVAHTDPSFLPKSSSVVTADHLLTKVDPGTAHKSTAIIAIVRPHGLTAGDTQWFRAGLRKLSSHEGQYGLVLVQDAFNTPKSVRHSFVSPDGTTEIALIAFPQSDVASRTSSSYHKVQTLFRSPPPGSRLYFTGDVPIQTDNIAISLGGAKRTALVTILLVLVILVLILRSLVAPLVNLLTIGVSFLISSGLVAWLAGFGFPVSTFTQTFLIAILFGAGTDYSIIMLNRFREELTDARHVGAADAIATSIRAIGRTVAFSAATVALSFAVLALAHFGLYRSSVGVAVGIAVTLAACLTLIPALMAIFGRTLFWPRPPVVGVAHRPSRLWAGTSRLAVRHPWWTMLALLAVLVPTALLFTPQRSFDTLADIPQAGSVHGFHAVAKAFGEGSVMPVEIVIQSRANLRTPKGLASLESVAQALSKSPHVQKVYTATRPEGKVLPQLQLAYQNSVAAKNLGRISSGLHQLTAGLGSASGALSAGSAAQLASGAQRFGAAAGPLMQGAASLASGARNLATGADGTASGAAALSGALRPLTAGSQQAATAAATIAAGTAQAAGSAGQVAGAAGSLSSSEQKLGSLAQSLAQSLSDWARAHPGTGTDPQWQEIMASAESLAQGTGSAQAAAGSLAQGTAQLSGALTGLKSGTMALSGSLAQLSLGLRSAQSGAGQLAKGAGALAGGAQGLSQGAGHLESGISSWAAGGSALASGYAKAASGASTLGRGISSAAASAARLASGTDQVAKALGATKTAQSNGSPGFYLPASALTNPQLQKAMQAYISPDGHVAVLNVDMALDPYSAEAIAQVPSLVRVTRDALAASPVPQGSVYAAGTSAMQSDLNRISAGDFARTAALVLLVIFLLLAFMLRSILSPLYILTSLVGGYFVTMGIVQTLVPHVFHVAAMDWTVPFFALLLLVALGVDYSIFLMSRFEEIRRRGTEPEQAIQEAMARMGGVIFSAAVIMAGTFGSMAVTGVTGLVEIGGSVVLGLLIYTTVMLGLFLPAAVAIVGGAHHWPFVRVRAAEPAATPAD